MNIVIITTPYYPNMAAPSACINKYIQKLKFFHSIDVINPLTTEYFEPLNDPNIVIHYVSNCLWRWRMRCLENLKNGKFVFLNRFIINLFRIRTYLLASFSYPTIHSWQLNAFYKELERIQETKNIDVIISVVNPICSTFSALKFKKKYPNVKWITYFTDPFTFHPVVYTGVIFKNFRKKINFKWEKEIYDTANYNLFTEELYKMALHDFNQPPSKTICFKYILDRIVSTDVLPKTCHSDRCTLVYAGNVYMHRRNPKIALSVLSKVEFIRLDLYVPYGKCDSIISEYLSDNIRRYPSVDRSKYNNIICNEYDILVNIGNNFNLQIPSKMLELLSTGRPIINFYQMKDSHYEMIEKYPLGINIGPDDPDSLERVTSFCQQMRGRRLSIEDVERIFPENTLDNQLAILEKLLND